jgi:hypothetical protein
VLAKNSFYFHVVTMVTGMRYLPAIAQTMTRKKNKCTVMVRYEMSGKLMVAINLRLQPVMTQFERKSCGRPDLGPNGRGEVAAPTGIIGNPDHIFSN